MLTMEGCATARPSRQKEAREARKEMEGEPSRGRRRSKGKGRHFLGKGVVIIPCQNLMSFLLKNLAMGFCIRIPQKPVV